MVSHIYKYKNIVDVSYIRQTNARLSPAWTQDLYAREIIQLYMQPR
jgi:hypothetical protein